MAVVTVAFEDLDSWLQAQPENTVDTPYDLNITGLTATDCSSSLTNGTLGYILGQNNKKYVDLSETVLPSVTSMYNTFNGCSSLVNAPVIPDGVTNMDGTFGGCTFSQAPAIPDSVTSMNYTFQFCTSLVIAPVIPDGVVSMNDTFGGCTSLVNAPAIPDGVTNMYRTFISCTRLSHKPIIPSTVTNSTDCYRGVTTQNWKGTESQVNFYVGNLGANTNGFNMQVYNNDRVTLEDTYLVVGIDKVSSYLDSLPANTMDTPYEVIVSGLTTSNYTNLKNIIRQTTRYIGLSNTSIPNGVTSINDLFDTCPRLITPPLLPDSITQMGYAFLNCTWMKYAPEIPSSVYNMQGTFSGCQKLKEAPIIPDAVTDFQYTFQDCSSLEKPPILGSRIQGVTRAFENCTALLYKPIIPSSVRPGYDTDVFKNVTQTKWGGSTSQLESFVASQTSEFEVWEIEADTENNCYEPTGRVVYGVDLGNVDTLLNSLDENTVDTPYELKVINIDQTHLTLLADKLYQAQDRYVDLRYTTYPYFASIKDQYGFLLNGSENLIYPPSLPEGITSLVSAFNGCSNLKETPTIPSTVTQLSETFMGCRSLTTIGTLPNGVTGVTRTFKNCTSLVTAPTIPNSVTVMSETFENCSSLENITLPNNVGSIYCCFKGCTSLTNAPSLPNTVGIMTNAFEGCSAITEIALIPATVAYAVEAFKNCSSLRKITEFQIPLNTLKNNANFQNMFQGCTSLSEIGYVIKESSWHVWRLKFGSNTVEGKVFFDENTSVNIPQTSITKSDLNLPLYTDELWFPHGQEEDETKIDELIVKMLQYKYGVFKKTVLPPDQKNFVMWADDPNNFQTNIPIAPVDVVEAGNMNPVTSNAVVPVDKVALDNMHSVSSNAVAVAISYSETEQFTGKYWINGKPIYRLVWRFNVNPSDSCHIHNFYFDEIIDLRGFVRSHEYTMCIPMYGNLNGNWQTYIIASKDTHEVFASFNCTAFISGKVIVDIIIEYTKTTD